MIDFQYTGLASDGKSCQGTVRAPTPEAARLRLIGQGVTPIRIETASDAPAGEVSRGGGAKLKRNEVLLFTREMAHLKQANMPLAIEPLHPAYAADRACVNTTRQALDICDALDPARSGALGVALDVYHIWWDPELLPQIARAGKGRLLAFHVCDWLVPTKDILNDRGMMGDGVIDVPMIRGLVESGGYSGPVEVEIFSAENWWKKPMSETLQVCRERLASAT